MPDYRVRAVWDLGNAAQFEAGIKATVNSSNATIKSATAVASNPSTETASILSKSEAAIRSYYNNVKPAFANLATTITDPSVNATLSRSIGLLDNQIGKIRQLRTEYIAANEAFLNPSKLSANTPYGSAAAQLETAKSNLQQVPVRQALLRDEIVPALQAQLAQQEAELQAATQFLKGGERNPLTSGLANLGGGYYAPPDLLSARNATRNQIAAVNPQAEQTEYTAAKVEVDRLVALKEAERQKLKEIAEQKINDLRVASAQYAETQRQATGEVQLLGAQKTNFDSQQQSFSRAQPGLKQASTAVKTLQDDYTGLGRVIQRTVEYASVAAITYGAFSAAVSQVQNINALNTGLNRLAITSQLSRAEVSQLFNSLTQVASGTATPLLEVVNAADDIALAVRKAGQTTKEYQSDIISLTTAVGILTNLTGIDTVQATDKLTSAYKQLGLAPDQLLGVLNKATAVGGGQSQAIADIITGLASVSAAAKNAGLDINQMIGSIQVLSQVTNKSADEVAVSFKNIFGSLIGPASIKTLHEYGIEVKDALGNVRPFLTVIGEVYNAIQRGIIPAGQIEVVERAIAGGPRRAPDVAAIIQNYPQIASVTQQAAAASNEALVANARVLDTNAAKLTQLQVALESTIYKSFAATITNIVQALLTLGLQFTKVLQAAGPITPFLITMATTVLALVSGAKVLAGIMSLVGRAFGATRTEVVATTGAIEAEGTAAEVASQKNSLLNRARNFGTGALIGGAVAAASGGNLGDIVGGGLTAAGTASLLTGDIPLGLAAIVGGQLTSNIFGAHQGDQQQNQEDLLQQRQQLVQNIATYQQAKQAVTDLAGKEDILSKSIESLQKIQHPSISQTNQLIGLQEQYAAAVLDSAAANDTMATSFKNIAPGIQSIQQFVQAGIAGNLKPSDLEALKQSATSAIIRQTNPDFQEGGKFFGQDVGALSQIPTSSGATYVPPPPATQPLINPNYLTPGKTAPTNLKDIYDQYVAGLRQIDSDVADGVIDSTEADKRTQDLVNLYRDAINNANNLQSVIGNAPKEIPNTALQDYNKLYANKPYLPANAQQFEQGRQFLPPTGSLIGTDTVHNTTVDLQKIALGAESVKDLFNDTGDKITAKFDLSQQSVAAVNAGIDLLIAKGDPLGKAFEKTWQQAIDGADIFSVVLDTVAKNIAVIQAQNELGIITDDKAKQLIAVQNSARLAATYEQNASTNSRSSDFPFLSPTPGSRQGIASAQQAFAANPSNAAAQKAFADEGLRALHVYDQLVAAGPNALANAESNYIEKVVGATSAIKVNTQALIANDDALKKQKADLISGARSEEANLGQTKVNQLANLEGDIATPAKTKAEIADKNARIAADQQLLTQTNSLIDGTTKLKKAFIETNGVNPTAIKEFQKELSSLDYFTGLSTVDFNNLIPSLVGVAQQMGLNGQQTEKYINDVLALYDLTTKLNGLHSTVTIEVDVLTKDFSTLTSAAGGLPALPGNLAQTVTDTQNYIDALTKQGLAQQQIDDLKKQIAKDLASGTGSAFGKPDKTGSAAAKQGPNVSLLDYSPDLLQAEKLGLTTQPADLKTIIANAIKLRDQIPGETKKDKNDIVEILNGTKKIAEVRGVSEDLLRKSMDELSAIEKARLEFDTKADQIRRIRVGSGDFAAIANVPFNSTSGVSVGTPNNITVNINGAGLTPAQYAVFADKIASEIKRSIAAG